MSTYNYNKTVIDYFLVDLVTLIIIICDCLGQ